MSNATLVTPGKASDKYPKAPTATVKVTQEAIDKGVRRSSSHCMFAEAVKQSILGAKRVSVDLQTIRFTDKSKSLRYVYLTPRIAQVALINYDQKVKPAPFTFKLRGGAVHKSSHGSHKKKSTVIRNRVSETKAKIVRLRDSGNVPEIVGGKLPPSSRFARRRAFGLR